MKKLFAGILLLGINLVASEVYATFQIEAKQSANLAFSSSGIINNIYVDIGNVVAKDTLLATLDNTDLQASYNVTNTTLQYIKKDLDRYESAKNVIDASKLDGMKNQYETTKAQLAYSQALLDKTYLKAPFDGVIISKEAEIGDAVSGQLLKTVFQIQSKSERKLILEFDQKYHNVVKVGNHFRFKVDGDTKTYTGKISKIYPLANTKTRKIKAEVLTKDLLVGLFGDGTITTK
jgi:membrane fusion protein (multidrug efflux system)